ncbi:MAG: hypothetical protein K2X86_08445 [Cytophagaceae bacterium]|nr:hypothetical protein [Cytophagaceae bacterium]
MNSISEIFGAGATFSYGSFAAFMLVFISLSVFTFISIRMAWEKIFGR